jgi:hypothetical protein
MLDNKQFQKAVDNYLYMIVNDRWFNEKKQRDQLNQITGLTGKDLDKLFSDIGEVIFNQADMGLKLD